MYNLPAMISVTKLRAGTTFAENGIAYQVLKYSHSKIGRGGANVKVSVRNLKNWAVEEKTFNSGTSVESVELQKRAMQYLYSDGSNFVFMDNKSFEQVEVDRSALGDRGVFLKEGGNINLVLLVEGDGETVIDVDLPPNVALGVTESDPGVKGNSATNSYKSAKLENGLGVKVPLFINVGDEVRIDTRSGEYVERVKRG